MATLTISGLNKTYGKKQALKDVNLDIADGEFFVMLGPSGAGKTTMLKSIAGLQEVDSGSVVIDGVTMDDVEPYHRNVAMAFESYALYPQKTVFENLASPLRSGRTGKYTAAEQQSRIDAVTTTLGINHLLQRLPKELSNGQRQRVALGRVLVRPADVYLLDEPLSHLDAKLRASMRAELKRLGQMSNTTSVYVTHDYQEALSLGDRIGILREGQLVQVGTPTDVWMRPVDTFVARSLGQPEMNLFDGRFENGQVVDDAGTVHVEVADSLGLTQGQRVRVGLRPSDISVASTQIPGYLQMKGRVQLVERLGRQVELSVTVGEEHIIVISDGEHPVAEHDDVLLQVPLHLVHLFEGTTDDPAAETLRIGAAQVLTTAGAHHG